MEQDADLFGETAVTRGFITREQLNAALEAQKTDASRPLGQILVDMGRITGPQATAIEKLNQVLVRQKAVKSGDEEDGEDLTGLTLGGCLILEKLSTGSMGTTFRAHHMRLDRDVVVKVLHPRLVAIEGNLERFANEARSAANLEHPAIVSVYDFDADQGYHFIVMQYVKGQDLRQVLEKRGHLGLRHALWIGARVLEGLAHAHAHHVVHRDIKPANLMITPEPRIKIADFGLVRILSRSTGEGISVFGEIIGTPQYMAPEQASGGDDFDHRVDIYSLGITLFELISGRPPFTGNSTLEVLERQIMDPLPLITSLVPEATPELQTFLETMCAKSMEDRFVSCEDALVAIQGLRQRERGSTSRQLPGSVHSQDPHTDPSRSMDAPPIVSEDALNELKSRLATSNLVSFEGSDDDAQAELIADSFSNLQVRSSALEKFERKLKRASKNPNKLVLQLMFDMLKEGHIDEILALEKKFEAALPTSAAVAFFLGQANERKGRMEEARAKIALATVLAPDHLPARLHLARLEVGMGRVDDAVQTLQEANRWHSNSVKAAVRLAEVLYVVKGDAAAAVPAYERAIELAPSRWQLRQQLAWILYELGRFKQAEAVLKEVIEWNPDAKPAKKLLKQVRKKRTRLRAAAAPADKTSDKDDPELEGQEPGAQTSACLQAIRLATASSKWERALEIADSGLDEKPRSVPLLLAKAKAQIELGRLSGAVSTYGFALSIDPNNEEAQQGLMNTQSRRRATTRRMPKDL